MLNPLDMTGKTVLVTGASSGIGRDASVLLSQLGARVIIMARSSDKLAQTRAMMEGDGHVVVAADLGDYEAIPGLLKRVTQEHGALDGLLHCAGFQMTVPLRALDAQRVQQMWAINVSCGLWLVKGYRQRGAGKPGGSIVFMSSASAVIGVVGMTAYSATKGAVIAMTRALAVELAREKIRVNCIAAGLVKTEMFDDLFSQQMPPDRRASLEREYLLGFGEPRDVSHTVAFLLSQAGRWITGSTIILDGGLTVR